MAKKKRTGRYSFNMNKIAPEKKEKKADMEKVIIAQGAEAIIKVIVREQGTTISKERIRKGYRIPVLDAVLRKRRTRIEARNLFKIGELVPTPKLIAVDEESARIEMEHLEGDRLSEVLEKEDLVAIAQTLGRYTARLHQNNIIHGDLTTSNFILSKELKPEENGEKQKKNRKKEEKREKQKEEKKLFCIDLGLSFHSTKQEDKAVDLHLLKEALQSRHHTIWERCFQEALAAYRNEYKKRGDDGKQEAIEILARLEKVELRGRNKAKKGS